MCKVKCKNRDRGAAAAAAVGAAAGEQAPILDVMKVPYAIRRLNEVTDCHSQ